MLSVIILIIVVILAYKAAPREKKDTDTCACEHTFFQRAPAKIGMQSVESLLITSPSGTPNSITRTYFVLT
jgi:hypothetical protein